MRLSHRRPNRSLNWMGIIFHRAGLSLSPIFYPYDPGRGSGSEVHLTLLLGCVEREI